MVMDILISLDDFYSMLRMLFTSDILCLILLRILDSLYHLIDCTSARSLLVLTCIDAYRPVLLIALIRSANSALDHSTR